MNRVFFILLMAINTHLFAEEISVDIRCFSSSNKSINLEFRAYTDNKIGWIGGQVRYKQSKDFIPLVFLKTETVREIEGRPWEFKHTWLEIVDGKVNGQYELVSQGAIVYSFTYINRVKNKSIDLSYSTPYDGGICHW